MFAQRRSWEAEFKIIIFFSYLLVFLWAVVCRDAIILALQEPFREVIEDYFLCEAVGHVPGRCSREPIERYAYVISILNCIYYIMNSLYSVVYLMFVINFRIAKEGILKMKIIQSFKSTSTRSSQPSNPPELAKSSYGC